MGIFNSDKNKSPVDGTNNNKPQSAIDRGNKTRDKWQVGDIILDQYVVRDIKKGGMGIVYIVHDITRENPRTQKYFSNKDFAVKTFQDIFLWDQDAKEKFIAEAETWVNLGRHTNIVFANFTTYIEGKPYVFLEYMDGGDLSKYIGKLTIPEIIECAIHICCGMSYAHDKFGIVHRDIKPSNIIGHKVKRIVETPKDCLKVNNQSKQHFKEWKISDFGMVKAVHVEQMTPQQSASQIVSCGMGTWPYMPPEQFSEHIQNQFNYSPRAVSTRSDIYAFGVTLFQLITGKLPFEQIRDIFIKDVPELKSSQDVQIPIELAAIILKCMNKKPENRYESFKQIKNELEKVYDNLLLEPESCSSKTLEKSKYFGTAEEFSFYDWICKGHSYEQLKKYEQALICYESSLMLDSESAYAWTGKGNCLYGCGINKEALTCYEKAIALDKKSLAALFNKGKILADNGDIEQALEYYQETLNLNQRIAINWIYSSTGVSYIALGGPQKAIIVYDRVLKTHPNNALTWILKGDALSELKNQDAALECYDQALKSQPGNLIALMGKGIIFDVTGKLKEALICYDKVTKKAPRYPPIWYNKALCLAHHTKKYTKAIACCDKALDINYADYKSVYVKGYCLEQLKKNDEALVVYKKCVELAPNWYPYIDFAKKFIRNHESF